MTKMKTQKNRKMNSYLDQVKRPKEHLIQVRIPEELFEEISEIKRDQGLSLREIVVAALFKARDELINT